jgi:mannose-6-phosphate isomerase-like protein (cupin superfamily)
MKTTLLLVLVLAASALMSAADPEGFVFWSGSDLRNYGKKLAPKMNDKKVATERLTEGKHFLMMAYREGDGEAEVHETMTDIFVVQSGEGTLVVGGKVLGGRNTGPGEIRGDSIDGGGKRELRAGDVARIPPKTPHRVLVAPGKSINYMIVKVTE